MGLIHYENDFESLIRDKAVVDFMLLGVALARCLVLYLKM